jgi:hypothetical protein
MKQINNSAKNALLSGLTEPLYLQYWQQYRGPKKNERSHRSSGGPRSTHAARRWRHQQRMTTGTACNNWIGLIYRLAQLRHLMNQPTTMAGSNSFMISGRHSKA